MMRSRGQNIIIASSLDASSIERVMCQRYLVFVLWNG